LSITGNSKKGCVRGVLRYPAQQYASKRLNKKQIYETRHETQIRNTENSTEINSLKIKWSSYKACFCVVHIECESKLQTDGIRHLLVTKISKPIFS